MNESPNSPQPEDPMVAQDKPTNKLKRGLLYGAIVVVVMVVLLIAFTRSAKHSTSPASANTVTDSSVSN